MIKFKDLWANSYRVWVDWLLPPFLATFRKTLSVLPSSEISFEATYIKTDAGKTDFNALLAFINVASGTTQDWKMSTDQITPVAYYGTAILADLEISAAAGDEFATYSGTLQNSGLITETDPNV